MTPRECMTAKEIQIAIHVWEGLTNREISRIAGTTEQVIKNHLRAIFAFPGEPQHMAYTEIFWMACDSTEQLRAEYGPFHTRPEAEIQARKLGFGYLLRYEHLLGVDEEIEEVRCIFVELPGAHPI